MIIKIMNELEKIEDRFERDLENLLISYKAEISIDRDSDKIVVYFPYDYERESHPIINLGSFIDGMH